MKTIREFKNKIICGDCLKIMKEIPDNSIDLIVTDPPYGILPKGKNRDKFEWDNINLEQFTKKWFKELYKKGKENSFLYIFWSQKYLKLGFEIFNPDRLIFWRYNNLINGGNGDFAYDYESIFVIKKGNPKLIKGKHSCDLEYTKPQSNFRNDKLLHPTQKSLQLIKHLIKISSNENDTVLDPFMGSGTTCVAAKKLKRNYIGIEIDKKYYRMTEDRLIII